MEFLRFLENKLDVPSDAETFCGVLGGEKPSTYSVSPKMWNAVFSEYDIPAFYGAFDVAKENLKGFMRSVSTEEKFRGMNVTVPYKRDVIPLLQKTDPQAAEYQAVNTVHKDAETVGYNTDGVGEARNLQDALGSLEGKKILQLGAGGAGNAVSYALVEAGAELIISNRTVEKAKDLSERISSFFKLESAPVFGGEDIIQEYAPECDVILNVSLKGQQGTDLEGTSSLSSAGPDNLEESMRLAERVPNNVLFADIIYKPEETVFLRHGRETGHGTLNGKMMLVHQAARAMEILYAAELEEAKADTWSVTRIMKEAFG